MFKFFYVTLFLLIWTSSNIFASEPECRILNQRSGVWITRRNFIGCGAEVAICHINYQCTFPETGARVSGTAECSANPGRNTCPPLRTCMEEEKESRPIQAQIEEIHPRELAPLRDSQGAK